MRFLYLLFISSLISLAATAQDSAVYEFAAVPPQAKIDLKKFIAKRVKYPDLTFETGVQGTVYIKFIVTKDGDIKNPMVAKGLKNGGAGLNEEALRVVSLIPKGSFTPAENNGAPVACWITIPIRFKIGGEDNTQKEQPAIVAAAPTVNLDDFFSANVNAKKIKKKLTESNGTVSVKALVDREGKIDAKSVKITNGASKKLDKEAVRLVKLLPAYKPATLDGMPADAWVEIPVNFWKYKKQRAEL
jgi:TonB family protein